MSYSLSIIQLNANHTSKIHIVGNPYETKDVNLTSMKLLISDNNQIKYFWAVIFFAKLSEMLT